MTVAAQIIERLGGTREASKRLNLPPSTIQSWKESGFIPAKHQRAVLDAGQALDPPISPAEFFAEPERAAS